MIKRFKGRAIRWLYTYTCPYCGCRVPDCYDDPWTCPDCGR